MAAIKAVVLDIDGVFTDGTVSLGSEDDERKSLHFADIMGVARALKNGILFGLITGEGGLLVTRIAAKLGISDVTTNCKTKDVALRAFASRHNLHLAEILFVGDDILDVPAFQIAGHSAAPADAQHCAIEAAQFTARRNGGHGAVREILESLVGPIA